MLRILEITFAVIFCAFGVYFGSKAALSIFKYLADYYYYSIHADDKMRCLKYQAVYFSLSVTAFLVALTLGLHNLVGLLFIPILVGLLWLRYVIYRAVTLSSTGRSK